MAKTVAESLVSTLREAGVRRVYGSVGDAAMVFAGELDDVSDTVGSNWRMLP